MYKSNKLKRRITKSSDELIKSKNELSKVDDVLSRRILMLKNIKMDRGKYRVGDLARDLEVDRKTIKNWINKFEDGGYKALLSRGYINIERNSNREGWVMKNEIIKKMKELLNSPENIYKTKKELFEALVYLLEVESYEGKKIRISTFYKCLSKLITIKEFQELMKKRRA